ncbi:hypothetical protein CSB85_3949 [Pseudomonas aeruginosa]|nr:hypothetical protein CSB85_3949 [Pseudomonas aeruginosa]
MPSQACPSAPRNAQESLSMPVFSPAATLSADGYMSIFFRYKWRIF